MDAIQLLNAAPIPRWRRQSIFDTEYRNWYVKVGEFLRGSATPCKNCGLPIEPTGGNLYPYTHVDAEQQKCGKAEAL